METERPIESVDTDAILDQLARVLLWSSEFTLAFVKCNHAAQCDVMRNALRDRVKDRRILEVELDKPIVSLLMELRKRWDEDNGNPPDAVCVFGLEKSINEQREESPVLGRLNHDRDLLRRLIPGALLIWLPDFALDLIARGAPDFWAWRSGVYEFPTHTELWQQDSDAAVLDNNELLSFSMNDKQKEIARIGVLLRTARSLPKQDRRSRATIVRLLNKLGILHYSLGDLAVARQYYEEGLAESRELGDLEAEAISLHRLGMIAQDQGDLPEARRYYEASLEIEKKIGHEKGIAASRHQLGTLAAEQGDLTEARRSYEESLEIERKVGNLSGIAISLHQLGTIAQQQGDLTEARRFYEESLEIEKKIGDQNGIAATLHQLGRLLQDQGDLAEARRLYEESLEIKKKLGNPYGIAIALNQLGRVAAAERKQIEALELFREALRILETLKSPTAEIARRNLTTLESQGKA